MKALTLTQPSATLVATGAKRVETRSWGTRYRGELAIHAAKRFPPAARTVCLDTPFFEALTHDRGRTSALDLPLGAVIATAELVEIVPVGPGQLRLGEQELAFGDYREGRYAWFLANVKPLPEPIPARGALGLWEWVWP
jgi:hypothetical protein